MKTHEKRREGVEDAIVVVVRHYRHTTALFLWERVVAYYSHHYCNYWEHHHHHHPFFFFAFPLRVLDELWRGERRRRWWELVGEDNDDVDDSGDVDGLLASPRAADVPPLRKTTMRKRRW